MRTLYNRLSGKDQVLLEDIIDGTNTGTFLTKISAQRLKSTLSELEYTHKLTLYELMHLKCSGIFSGDILDVENLFRK